MSRYLDRLFETAADRVADRVSARLSVQLAEIESHVAGMEATLEVLLDEGALDDLREAASAPDDQARPYREIRRELGLA